MVGLYVVFGAKCRGVEIKKVPLASQLTGKS